MLTEDSKERWPHWDWLSLRFKRDSAPECENPMDPFRLVCTGIDPVGGNVIHVAGITQKRNNV